MRALAPDPAGAGATMQQVDVIERNEQFEPVAKITADAAEFDPGADPQGWRLINDRRVRGLRKEERPTRPEPVSFWPSGITPTEVELTGEEADPGREVTFRFRRTGFRALTISRRVRGPPWVGRQGVR